MHKDVISSNCSNLKEQKKESFVLRIGSKIPFAGIYCTIIAGFLFTLSKLVVKCITTIHPVEFIMIRSFFSFMMYLPFVLRRRVSLFGENQIQFVFLVLRGVLGMIVCICSYLALWNIPLGDSVTILLSATVYTSFFAKFFLGEDFSLLNFVLILLTMGGIILIAKPPFLFEMHNIEYNVNRVIGIILTLIAAVCFSLSYCVMRKLKGVHIDLIIIYFSMFTFTGSAIVVTIYKFVLDYSSVIKLPSTYQEYLSIVLMSIFSSFGEFFLTCSLQLEKAYIVSITRGSDIIIAFLIQILFLKNETIEWTSILGSFIILFGIIFTAIIKYFNEYKSKVDLNNQENNKNSQNQLNKSPIKDNHQ